MYNYSFFVLLFILGLFACTQSTECENESDCKYEYVLNKKGVTYEKFFIKNIKENKIVKEIVFSEINPFNHLGFPVEKIDNHGNKIYDLSRVSNKRILKKLGDFSLNEKALNQKIYSASCQFTGTDKRTKDHVALAFKFNLIGKENRPISQLTKILVFNSKGEIVSRFSESDFGCNNLALTNNGKYMVVHFGGLYGCGGNDKFVEGFRFYDVENQKMLFDEIKNSRRFGAPYAKDDLIVISEDKGYGITEFYIYDFSKNIKYSKLFSRSLNINEIDETGVFGIDENGNAGRFSFDLDFEKTEII